MPSFVDGESSGSSEDNIGLADIAGSDTTDDLGDVFESDSLAFCPSYRTSYIHGFRCVSLGPLRRALLVGVFGYDFSMGWGNSYGIDSELAAVSVGPAMSLTSLECRALQVARRLSRFEYLRS